MMPTDTDCMAELLAMIKCDNPVDPCDPNPCLNGGTCAATEDGGASCKCVDGYTGDTCEVASSELGAECTPDGLAGQSSCGEGYICIELKGSNGAYCTKKCDGPGDGICNDGYAGPGIGECIYNYKASDVESFTVCGIICSDLTDNQSICPDCDGSCPSQLKCEDPLSGANGNTLAEACF